jgi:hypothetical protein
MHVVISGREALLKGKALYGRPPGTKKFLNQHVIVCSSVLKPIPPNPNYVPALQTNILTSIKMNDVVKRSSL